ncbi:MAG: tRNA threonylcarbamoyladenosine dehydratase [Clostridia bacterium]|nr:tRNA threonylcarbamoyladenosine dehydratase [Clostridia bacterium]
MQDSMYTRTEMLLGTEGIEKLKKACVAVFGVGGVGGFAVEAIARAGVGKIVLIDADTVSPSNINRQIIATSKTVGRYKTEVARERIREINPDCTVECYNIFYSEESTGGICLSDFDYVIDAIDSVRSKLFLIEGAVRAGVRIISSMGTGNKLDPTRFAVTDISKTHTCPLARVIRTELKKRKITQLKVLFSDEPPINPTGERLPGSVSFVPSVAGLIIGGAVIRDIVGI